MKDYREKVVIKTSVVSIISNIVLAGFKAFVGLLANSIAIISDAVNNLSDALSSIITIVGTKLAGKPPDKKHPYGYGRIEYMTSLIVSGIVLYAGITAFVESVKKIIHPEVADYSTITLIILIVGIIVKFILGIYVKKKGKEVNSDSLVASGSDAFNDAILSISVLASAIIYMLFKISLEAYVGVLLSVFIIFIIKAGLELIKESVDNMLGVRIESSLAKSIKRDIAKEKDIQGAYDLTLHDYGPDRYSGSVHIEVSDTLTASDIDRLSRIVPHLCKVAPSTSEYHVSDVHRAGGVIGILAELDRAGLIHKNALHVSASSIGELINKYDIKNNPTDDVKHLYLAAPGGQVNNQPFHQNTFYFCTCFSYYLYVI